MEENPYRAPEAGNTGPVKTRNRNWSIACILLAVFWSLLVIAMVLPTITIVVGGTRVEVPSPAEKVVYVTLGALPTIGLFWLAWRTFR